VLPGGASTDIDDVAGEIDQDRGEGSCPFREDSLPDAEVRPARVVPGHSEGIGRLRLPAGQEKEISLAI